MKKAQANLRKHEVDFADAATVFDDELAVVIPDPDADEERFVAIGADAQARLLVVIFCWRGDRIRIISARRATRPERRHHEG